MPSRPYEFFDDIHTVVSYELDLNLYEVDRSTYNFLDWLGDLGGLKEALIIIFGSVYGLPSNRRGNTGLYPDKKSWGIV